MKALKSNSLLSALLFLMTACSLPTGPETDPLNQTDTSTTKVLAALGVSTDLGSRMDPNENELSDSYNPMDGVMTTMWKRSEIYQAGMSLNGQLNALLQDNTYSTLIQQTDGTWSESPKKAINADVDGDGIEDVVIAVFYIDGSNDDMISIRVLNYQASTQTSQEKRRFDVSADGLDLSGALDGYAGTDGSGALPGNSTKDDAFLRQDLAAGDLDGDGKDEIVITVGLMVYILDDAGNGFSTLASRSMSNLSTNSDTVLRVDTADYDLDGRDEIVIVNGEDESGIVAQFLIYDDILANTTLSSPLSSGNILVTSGSTYSMRAADVTTGDYDGDGLPETAFCGMSSGDDTSLITLILDTAMSSASSPVFSFLSAHASQDAVFSKSLTSYAIDTGLGATVQSGTYTYCSLIPGMGSGDIDGALNSAGLKVDEIVAGREIYRLSGSSLTRPWGSYAVTEASDSFCVAADLLRVADVNNDMKADVVYMPYGFGLDYELKILETNDEDDGLAIVSKSMDSVSYDTYFSNIYDTEASRPLEAYPTICLSNIDTDSVVVRYLGHELLFTNPVIVAAIASPPFWTGINDGGQGHTAFGYIEGTSNSTEENQSFSVGMSVGFEVEDPLGTSSISGQATVSSSMNWGIATTHEVEETWGYTTGIGEDKIVFTSIPFDVYYYEVVTGPSSTAHVGQMMTVSVPRALGTYNVERTFYNANNGDGRDVNFHPSPGTPGSYHGSADISSLASATLGGLFSSNTLTVGQSGTGTTAITMSSTAITTSSKSIELSVEVEANAKVEYMTMGVSTGYANSFSYQTSVTTGTYIEGEVPDVPAGDSSLLFDWGLMAYPTVDGDQKYTVVSYYVN